MSRLAFLFVLALVPALDAAVEPWPPMRAALAP